MGKIIVFGDSIAYGKWDTQGGWVARLRNYIDEKYNKSYTNNFLVYNQSIPGDLSVRIVSRIESEAAARLNPQENNLIIYAYGLNDANPANRMTQKQTSPEEFKNNIVSCVNIAHKAKAKVVVIGLTSINEGTFNDYTALFKGVFNNNHVEQYDSYIKEVCQKMEVPMCPLYEYLIKKEFKDLLVDGIHPNSKGHEMIYEIIKEFLIEHGLIEYCK